MCAGAHGRVVLDVGDGFTVALPDESVELVYIYAAYVCHCRESSH